MVLLHWQMMYSYSDQLSQMPNIFILSEMVLSILLKEKFAVT